MHCARLATPTRPVGGSWTGRTGRIGNVGVDLLDEVAEGLDHPVYYLCGAPGFVEVCYRRLESSGVPEPETGGLELWVPFKV